MKLFYTEQSLASLQECLDFFPPEVTAQKVNEIRDRILAKAEKLLDNPHIGQREEYLEHLGLGHRRLIEGNYKIVGEEHQRWRRNINLHQPFGLMMHE